MAYFHLICAMKKIRIAYTIPNFDTAGSGKALLNIAKGLDPNRFDVHIVCKSEKGSFFAVVKKSGIPVHVFNYLPVSRPLFSLLKEILDVVRIWREINPDIVHSFHYSDNYSEGLAVRLAGKKWVFTKKNMSWVGNSGRAWILRSALANAIVVQNTDMIEQFYPRSKKITLISRGVNISQFKPSKVKPEIRERMQTPSQARIIICVANMVPVKGVELLIDAYLRLGHNYTDWHLWLVGDIDNEYGRKLIDIVQEKNQSENIHFSGKQQNIREYLDHAEIFVLPTKDEGRREGSPVALLEAMANGKIVIGSAVPGVKDQLHNFPDFQFIPGNLNSLVDTLLPFMKNSTEQNLKLGKSFSEHVERNYSIENEIIKHQNFYLKI